jgi:hypothetical protein
MSIRNEIKKLHNNINNLRHKMSIHAFPSSGQTSSNHTANASASKHPEGEEA